MNPHIVRVKNPPLAEMTWWATTDSRSGFGKTPVEAYEDWLAWDRGDRSNRLNAHESEMKFAYERKLSPFAKFAARRISIVPA